MTACPSRRVLPTMIQTNGTTATTTTTTTGRRTTFAPHPSDTRRSSADASSPSLLLYSDKRFSCSSLSSPQDRQDHDLLQQLVCQRQQRYARSVSAPATCSPSTETSSAALLRNRPRGFTSQLRRLKRQQLLQAVGMSSSTITEPPQNEKDAPQPVSSKSAAPPVPPMRKFGGGSSPISKKVQRCPDYYCPAAPHSADVLSSSTSSSSSSSSSSDTLVSAPPMEEVSKPSKSSSSRSNKFCRTPWTLFPEISTTIPTVSSANAKQWYYLIFQALILVTQIWMLTCHNNTQGPLSTSSSAVKLMHPHPNAKMNTSPFQMKTRNFGSVFSSFSLDETFLSCWFSKQERPNNVVDDDGDYRLHDTYPVVDKTTVQDVSEFSCFPEDDSWIGNGTALH